MRIKDIFISKMQICILLTGAMFTLCGCRQHNELIVKFPKEYALRGKIVHELDSMYSAYNVKFIAGRYIFAQRDSFFFSIYNQNFKKEGELARKGHGADEWIAPCATGQQVIKGGKQYFYVLERPIHKLFLLPLDKSAQPILVEDFKQADGKDFRYVFKTTSDTFVGSLDNDDCDFFVFNRKKATFNAIEYKGLDISSLKGGVHLLSQNIAAYNEKFGKTAVAYFSFPVLLIRDEEGNVVKEIKFGEQPQYTSENMDDAPLYVLDITCDDGNIYLLYDDPKYKDKMSILVFDWKGNPKERLWIKRSVAFTINKNKILAINEDMKQGVCAEYSLTLK